MLLLSKKKQFQQNLAFLKKTDLDWQLVMIWVERHLLYSQVRRNSIADFYCHLDWGYFRQGKVIRPWAEASVLNQLDESRIHLGLVELKSPAHWKRMRRAAESG